MDMDAALFGVFILCMIALSLLTLAFWIWMLVDCATHEPGNSNDKIVWILVIVLAGFIGAVVYYFARRPTRLAQFGA